MTIYPTRPRPRPPVITPWVAPELEPEEEVK